MFVSFERDLKRVEKFTLNKMRKMVFYLNLCCSLNRFGILRWDKVTLISNSSKSTVLPVSVYKTVIEKMRRGKPYPAVNV